MSTRKVYWPEVLRIWAQWLGLGLAAIPTGLMFGILLRSGISQRAALAVSLVVGFALSLLFWILISRRIAVKPVQWSPTVTADTISLDPAYAVATVVLCLTLYTSQPPAVTMAPSVSISANALS